MSNIINNLLECNSDELVEMYFPLDYKNIKYEERVDGVLYLLFVLLNVRDEELIEKINELFIVPNKSKIVRNFALGGISDILLINSIFNGVIDLKKFLENNILSSVKKYELLIKTFSGDKPVSRHLTVFSELLIKLDKIDKLEIELELKKNNIDIFLKIYRDIIYDKDFLTNPIFIIYNLISEANKFKIICNDIDKTSKLYFYEYLLNTDSKYIDFIKTELQKYYITDIDLVCYLIEVVLKKYNLKKLEEINKIVAFELKTTVVEYCEEILDDYEERDLYGQYKGKCCYDVGGFKCENFHILEDGLCKCKTVPTEGGSDNDYKNKYLKYKSKYLTLKKLNGIL
jgi:hypothetical protein